MATSDIYATTFDEEDGKTLSQTNCPECEGTLATEGGETACTTCGLIISMNDINYGPEWRTFEDTHNEKRTGAPRTPARHDHGLSTEIGHDPVHSGRKRQQLKRLRREHSRAKRSSTADQNLMYGLIDIRRLVDSLGLSYTVRDRAATIFRTAQDAGLFQGRSLEAMAAASVYAACRCLDLPRTLPEIEDATHCDLSSLRHTYHVLNVELGLKIQPLTPLAFIPRLASHLNVETDTRYDARQLAKHAQDERIDIGRNPVGFAAACLYVASGGAQGPLTQTDVAAASNVSTATIRIQAKRLQELRQSRPPQKTAGQVEG